MARERVFAESGSRSKKSFDIALLTIMFLVAGAIMMVLSISGGFWSWYFVLMYVTIAIIGFSLAWIVKKIEHWRDKW